MNEFAGLGWLLFRLLIAAVGVVEVLTWAGSMFRGAMQVDD